MPVLFPFVVTVGLVASLVAQAALPLITPML
jgi:hypothetical protein